MGSCSGSVVGENLRILQSHFICQCCNFDFDDGERVPKCLACHHKFCLSCLERIRIEESVSRTEGDLVRCPVCRHPNLMPFLTNLSTHLRTDHELLSLKKSVFQQLAGSAGFNGDNQPAACLQVALGQARTPLPTESTIVPVSSMVRGQERSSFRNPAVRTTPSLSNFSFSEISDAGEFNEENDTVACTPPDTKKNRKKKLKKRKGKKSSKKIKKVKKGKGRVKHHQSSCSSPSDSDSESTSNQSSPSSSDSGKKRMAFKTSDDELRVLMRKSVGVKQKKDSSKPREQRKTESVFFKDLFLCSIANILEMPRSTEFSSLAKAGLGMKCGVKFRVDGTSDDVERKFSRTFPRLEEVSNYYICSRMAGNGRGVDIKFFTVPAAIELKRLSGNIIVLIPLQNSLAYEQDNGKPITCAQCGDVVSIRLWAQHINMDCVMLPSSSRKLRNARK